MKIEERMGHMEDNIGRIVKTLHFKRKIFLNKMKWAMILMRIKIVLMLSYHP